MKKFIASIALVFTVLPSFAQEQKDAIQAVKVNVLKKCHIDFEKNAFLLFFENPVLDSLPSVKVCSTYQQACEKLDEARCQTIEKRFVDDDNKRIVGFRIKSYPLSVIVDGKRYNLYYKATDGKKTNLIVKEI